MPASPAEDPSSVLKDDPLLKQVPEVEGYKVLEPCVLYAKVGEGGMGAVYRGRHLNLDIDVAIKCLKNVLAEQSPAFVTRFQREARIAASVHHQNLVQVYDISEKNGVHYLVMEYVRGETARERVSRKKRLRETEALKILFGAASGLAEAHGQRIVHRDIKPDNILISYDGKVKVSDLGLAKALEVDAGPSLTQGVMGTPQYMAPEQWEDSAKVGPPADVWALGATFYYLLTGEHAISGGTMQQIFKRICVDPFPSIQEKLPSLSAQARAVLERCTRRDPAERFSDCRELVRELSKFVAKDAPGPEMVDLESGTTRVPPLLSPPPAETLGHIRVALSDTNDRTMQVATPAPGTKKGVAAPAGVMPPLQPATTAGAAAAPPAPHRPKTAVLAGIVTIVGLSGWFVIRIVQAEGPKPDPKENTPSPASIVLPALHVADAGPLYFGPQSELEIRGSVENRTSGEVWLEDEHGNRLGEVSIVEGSFALRPGPLTSLDERPHKLKVLTQDAEAAGVDVICDRTPPKITTIEFPESSKQVVSLLRFKVDDTNLDPGSVEVKGAISGKPLLVKDSEWKAEVTLSEGLNKLVVLARDRAGNPNELPREIRVDLAKPEPPPEFRITAPKELEGLFTKEPSLTIDGQILNRKSGTVLILENGTTLQEASLSEGSFSATISLPSDGVHRLDLLMNEATEKIEVTVDTREPSIDVQDSIVARETPYGLKVHVADDHIKQVSINQKVAEPAADGSWEASISLTAESTAVQVVAEDLAGWVSSRTVTVILDTTYPLSPTPTPEAGCPIPPGSNPISLAFGEPDLRVSIVGEGSYTSDRNGLVELDIEVLASESEHALRGTVSDHAENTQPFEFTWPVRERFVRPPGWDVEEKAGYDRELRANLIRDLKTDVWFRLLPDSRPPTYIAQTELTVGQFRRWPEGKDKPGEENCPVTEVSWKQAMKYCEFFGYDLPTQQEWTSACLGAQASYPSGIGDENLFLHAWHNWLTKKDRPDRPTGPQPVRKLSHNQLELYDMLGNVWEMCRDRTKLGGSYSTPPELCRAVEGRFTDSYKAGEAGTKDTGFRPVYRGKD